MTAIEWLVEQLTERGHIIPDHLEEQAIQMDRTEHGKTWDAAIDAMDKRGYNVARAYTDFDDYFAETYGSNGSDEHIVDTNEMISSQTEISDEEIHRQADKEFRHFEDEDKDIWIRACQWYREQLKQRQ
jgi:hypothetical protein